MDYRNISEKEKNWYDMRTTDKTAFVLIDGEKIYLSR